MVRIPLRTIYWFQQSHSDAIFTDIKMTEKPDKPTAHSTLYRCKGFDSWYIWIYRPFGSLPHGPLPNSILCIICASVGYLFSLCSLFLFYIILRYLLLYPQCFSSVFSFQSIIQSGVWHTITISFLVRSVPQTYVGLIIILCLQIGWVLVACFQCFCFPI